MHAQTKACSDVCLVHGLATAGEAGTGFSALAPSDTPPPLAPCCGPSPPLGSWRPLCRCSQAAESRAALHPPDLQPVRGEALATPSLIAEVTHRIARVPARRCCSGLLDGGPTARWRFPGYAHLGCAGVAILSAHGVDPTPTHPGHFREVFPSIIPGVGWTAVRASPVRAGDLLGCSHRPPAWGCAAVLRRIGSALHMLVVAAIHRAPARVERRGCRDRNPPVLHAWPDFFVRGGRLHRSFPIIVADPMLNRASPSAGSICGSLASRLEMNAAVGVRAHCAAGPESRACSRRLWRVGSVHCAPRSPVRTRAAQGECHSRDAMLRVTQGSL